MSDPKHEEDRWRELADLLGVSDDAARPAKAPPPVPPAPAPEPPPIKAYEEPRSLPVISAPPEEEAPSVPIRQEQDAPTIPMLRDEPAAEWEGEFDGEDDDTTLDESLAPGAEVPASADDGPSEQPAAPGDEDKPRRRRRRRGRRRGGADRPEGEAPEKRPPVEQAAPKVARPPRDREPDSRDQRGRGRQRDDDDARRPAPPPRQERRDPRPPVVEDLPEEQPARSHSVPASDTDFSDWNVPSWQDLIAALYRPDR